MGAVLLAAGCAHRPSAPEAVLPTPVPEHFVSLPSASHAADGWLADFGDPQLAALVGEALGGNLTLQAAMARLDQALALARIEGAERWPALAVSGAARRQTVNNLADPPVRARSDRFDLGAVAGWELDVWGRVRAQARAAQSDARAAEADFAALRLSLATRVAQAWFAAIEAAAQVALARETVASFEKNLGTVEERFQRGLNPALDVRLTRANVANARATLAQQQRLADAAVRQLEVLLGRYPAGAMAPAAELPRLGEPVPAGVPAELLQRRPDIVAAWQRLLAADARLVQSQRARLPAISLTASYGRASGELEDLLKSSFDVWSLVGNLTAPVFQGGRLAANVRRAEARRAEAAAAYGETVLSAFREVEVALVSEALLREQLVAVEAAAVESMGAQQLAEERYERGLADIITVLESQRRAFTARSAALAIQNQLLQNRLALYLALGGDIR